MDQKAINQLMQSSPEYRQRALCENCERLEKRIKVLEDALNKIANPIIYLQSKAEKEGSKLDGLMAIEFSNSASCLKEIARAALEVK